MNPLEKLSNSVASSANSSFSTNSPMRTSLDISSAEIQLKKTKSEIAKLENQPIDHLLQSCAGITTFQRLHSKLN